MDKLSISLLALNQRTAISKWCRHRLVQHLLVWFCIYFRHSFLVLQTLGTACHLDSLVSPCGSREQRLCMPSFVAVIYLHVCVKNSLCSMQRDYRTVSQCHEMTFHLNVQEKSQLWVQGSQPKYMSCICMSIRINHKI
jgi:hypothetical protein